MNTTPDFSPRAPGNRIAGSNETTERAQCTDPDPRCGSAFQTVSIADDVVSPSRAVPPEVRSNVIWAPVLRSAVAENVMSEQLGGPTAEPALELFDRDPEQATWTTQGTRWAKNESIRGKGPVDYNRPAAHQHVHQNGRGAS